MVLLDKNVHLRPHGTPRYNVEVFHLVKVFLLQMVLPDKNVHLGLHGTPSYNAEVFHLVKFSRTNGSPKKNVHLRPHGTISSSLEVFHLTKGFPPTDGSPRQEFSSQTT